MNTENLKSRYHAVLITVADLRQDLQARKLGLETDFTEEDTRRYLAKYEQILADLKAAIQAA